MSNDEDNIKVHMGDEDGGAEKQPEERPASDDHPSQPEGQDKTCDEAAVQGDKSETERQDDQEKHTDKNAETVADGSGEASMGDGGGHVELQPEEKSFGVEQQLEGQGKASEEAITPGEEGKTESQGSQEKHNCENTETIIDDSGEASKSVGTSTLPVTTETPEVSSTENEAPHRSMRAPRRPSYSSARGYGGSYQNYGLAYLPYKSNFEPSEAARRRADEFFKTLKL